MQSSSFRTLDGHPGRTRELESGDDDDYIAPWIAPRGGRSKWENPDEDRGYRQSYNYAAEFTYNYKTALLDYLV